MAEVSQPIFEGMTEAEARQAIKEYIDAKYTAMDAEVDARIAAATANAVQYGGRFSFKSYNGQFVCAHEGGPKEPNKVFEFQSRSSVGPHEVYEIVKV